MLPSSPLKNTSRSFHTTFGKHAAQNYYHHTTPSINLSSAEKQKQKTTLTIFIAASQWQNRVAFRFKPHFSHDSKTYEALYRLCWYLRNKYVSPSNVTSYSPRHPEAFPKWDHIVRYSLYTVRDHLWGYCKLKPFLLETSYPCPEHFSNEFCSEC